jgi:hypothetical protein
MAAIRFRNGVYQARISRKGYASISKSFLTKNDAVRWADLRHTAITALSKKLSNILELAAVTGHKELRMLKRYHHPDPEDLAKKLG